MWWRRLADRVIPPGALKGLGRVEWRIVDRPAPGSVTASSGFSIAVSRQLLNDGPFDYWGKRWHWKRWPVGSLWDLMPTFATSKDPIPYFRVPGS